MKRTSLFLVLVALTLALPAQYAFVDYAQTISADGEAAINRKLDTLEQLGLRIYAASLGKTTPKELSERGLESKNQEYNAVFFTGYSHETDSWAYGLQVDEYARHLRDPLFQRLEDVFISETNGASFLDSEHGTVMRRMYTKLFSEMIDDMQKVSRRYMEMQDANVEMAWPYLPVGDTLADLIDQFGNYLEINAVPQWEAIRRVHIDTNTLKATDYDQYLVDLADFSKSLANQVDAFTQTLEAAEVKTMYGRDLDTPVTDQPFHLHSGGHDWKEDRYYRRARDLIREKLTAGKIPQMLKEIAALENTFAYYYLDWLYELAGLTSELPIKLETVVDTSQGTPFTIKQGANQYTLVGLMKGQVGINIPAIFSRGGAGAKVELSRLEFENNRVGIKWNMLLSCESGYVEGAIGVGTDFIKPSLDAGVEGNPGFTLGGQDVNKSGTNALHYYPPLFFRDPGYHYRGVAGEFSGGRNGTVAKVDYTMAGDVIYKNGDRILGLSGEGLNASLAKGVGVGGSGGDNEGNIQFKMEIGVGACQGFWVTYESGIAPNLTNNPNPFQADRAPQTIKVVSVSFPSDSAQLDANDRTRLDRIVADLQLFRQHFPSKTLQVDILGYATGDWQKPQLPGDYPSPQNLSGLDAEVYANYTATQQIMVDVRDYLGQQIADKNITLYAPDGSTRIAIAPPAEPTFYRDPQAFESDLNTVFFGQDLDWSDRPERFRQVVIRLTASEL